MLEKNIFNNVFGISKQKQTSYKITLLNFSILPIMGNEQLTCLIKQVSVGATPIMPSDKQTDSTAS